MIKHLCIRSQSFQLGALSTVEAYNFDRRDDFSLYTKKNVRYHRNVSCEKINRMEDR
jgi:hypothetical protein